MNPKTESADFDAPANKDGWPAGEEPASTPTLADYPELGPVIQLALDAVIRSFYPEKIDARFRAYLERVTVAGTVTIYAPIAAIAAQAGRGAEDSRAARAATAARAAENLADCVAEVAAALQTRDDAFAVIVAHDASVAAELVAASALGTDAVEVAATAARVAAAVHEAAAAAALERAEAARLVAKTAAAAALAVSTAADAVAVAIELEISKIATALRTIALETCYQVAMNVAASAAEAVLADGMPDQSPYTPTLRALA